jgi:hypothetical protein
VVLSCSCQWMEILWTEAPHSEDVWDVVIAPRILNLGTGWRSLVCFTSLPLYL